MVLLGYGVSIALRFPLLSFGFGVKALLLGAGAMLLVSYYWFLRSRTTIDASRHPPELGDRQAGRVARGARRQDDRHPVLRLAVPAADGGADRQFVHHL